jgi:hypothetical protein
MSYVPPKKNTQYVFYAALVSQADTKAFQSNPTIATGDFKVSTDGSALQNLNTLPSVDPASSKLVKFTLSASEMNGDNVQIVGSDAAGAEWCDIVINIQSAVQQIDDLSLQTALTSSVADSVPADGSRPSVQQAIYGIWQFLMEKSLSGTTLTVKKPDGTTALMTFTLNSSTDPTSITRAS